MRLRGAIFYAYMYEAYTELHVCDGSPSMQRCNYSQASDYDDTFNINKWLPRFQRSVFKCVTQALSMILLLRNLEELRYNNTDSN